MGERSWLHLFLPQACFVTVDELRGAGMAAGACASLGYEQPGTDPANADHRRRDPIPHWGIGWGSNTTPALRDPLPWS